MPFLPMNHPALGAFRRKKIKQADWEYVATELAIELRRRIEHKETEAGCGCHAHLALSIYDEAYARAHPLPKEFPCQTPS